MKSPFHRPRTDRSRRRRSGGDRDRSKTQRHRWEWCTHQLPRPGRTVLHRRQRVDGRPSAGTWISPACTGNIGLPITRQPQDRVSGDRRQVEIGLTASSNRNPRATVSNRSRPTCGQKPRSWVSVGEFRRASAPASPTCRRRSPRPHRQDRRSVRIRVRRRAVEQHQRRTGSAPTQASSTSSACGRSRRPGRRGRGRNGNVFGQVLSSTAGAVHEELGLAGGARREQHVPRVVEATART